MTGVSKTLSGSSILSSPVTSIGYLWKTGFQCFFSLKG
jgi:hypothetical protein